MLRQVAQMSEADRRAAAARPPPAGSAGPTPDALRELVAAHEALRGGGREAARQAVFRPSHNLPTRTLAEQVCSWQELAAGFGHACPGFTYGFTYAIRHI